MAKLKKPKFLPGGKKKEEEEKEKAASPLMADDAKSSSASTASTAPPRLEMEREKDEKREARQKEREERNRQRDKRLADAQAAKQPKKGKGTTRPKLSQEEQDARDAKLGCCHHFQKTLVKLVHVIDALIGLTFLVYGALIHAFEDPALEASISSMAFGATMLFASAVGAVGFFTRFCWRFGLILSAYTAPFIALFYIFVIVALALSGDIYFDYLNEHKDVMYLDDNEIAVIKEILPFFYIALASLAVIEGTR